MKVMMSSLEQQTYGIIDDELEKTRVELLERFPQMFTMFARGSMEGIVVE